jgi:hypothetical protein
MLPSRDREHAIVMERIAAEDWHEQLLITVASVKAFFGHSKDKQDKVIKAAELTEAPLGVGRYRGDVCGHRRGRA